MTQHDWKDFRPTGMDVDPFSGNYVITTAEMRWLS